MWRDASKGYGPHKAIYNRLIRRSHTGQRLLNMPQSKALQKTALDHQPTGAESSCIPGGNHRSPVPSLISILKYRTNSSGDHGHYEWRAISHYVANSLRVPSHQTLNMTFSAKPRYH